MRWTVVVGVVGLLVFGGMVVALGGGIVDTPWSGENGEPDGGEPPNGDGNGEGPGDDPNGTDEDDREENDTDVDDGSESTVLFETYARSVSAGNELDSGTLTVTNETGETVLTHDISEGATRQVEGLTPGETYTVVVTDPNEGQVPPGSEEFDPSETETVEVVAGYEIRGVQSHRFAYKRNDTGVSFEAGESAYAENGDALTRLTNDPMFWDSSGIQFDFYTDGETDRGFRYTRSTEEWIEREQVPGHTEPLPSSVQLVQEPYKHHSPDEWLFIEEQTINQSAVFAEFEDENPAIQYHIEYIQDFEEQFVGTTAHVYNLTDRSSEFVDEYAYVDPDTGYVIRFEFGFYPDGTPEDRRYWAYDFFDHGEVEHVDEYNIDEITN